VYFGTTDEGPKPDANEVMDWKYMSLEKLAENISLHPQDYTAWLKICLPEVERRLKQKNVFIQ
jgi:isopentenyl-diphosphate delta-isomerase